MSPCAAWFRAALAGVFPGGPAESWGFGVGVRGSTLGPPPQLGTLPEDRLLLRRPFREKGAPDFPSLLYIISIIISPLRGDIGPISGVFIVFILMKFLPASLVYKFRDGDGHLADEARERE